MFYLRLSTGTMTLVVLETCALLQIAMLVLEKKDILIFFWVCDMRKLLKDSFRWSSGRTWCFTVHSYSLSQTNISFMQ